MESPLLRKIIHIDMDAFFASVEQRDFPEYRGKPIAVGGDPNKRGVVAAASYEARRFGVHSAMSSRLAVKKCPEIIFVYPRFEVYKSVSNQIRAIFTEYTNLIEPLSLDEAYLDVTVNHKEIPLATQIAQEIKDRIFEETRLTASAGVSFNKFLAKVASDVKKPNGLFVIPPEKAAHFLEQLPIEKFYGIGKVTATRMKSLGIHTGADLKKLSELQLAQYFGKTGLFYYQIVRAEDHRAVEPHRERKSVGAENTFDTDLIDLDVMRVEMEKLIDDVLSWMNSRAIYGRTLTVKVKYDNFEQVTRSKTLPWLLRDKAEIQYWADKLLYTTEAGERKVRLLGVTLSNLGTEDTIEYYEQLILEL